MNKNKFSDKTTGLLNFADLKKAKFKCLYWTIFAFMLLLSLICLIPALWVSLSGFKTLKELYAVPPTLLPKSIDFSVVKEVWRKVSIGMAFLKSVILIVGCLTCDIIVNGLAGYVLSRVRPMGSRIVETAVFWSMLLPGISMIPLYMTFVDVPLLNVNLMGSYLPIWLLAGASPFNILLFRNFFNGIPMSYLEAAKLDGCSDFNAFMKIILPLSKPILAVISIFTIIGTWGNFMWPYLILGDTNKEPVAVMLYRISAGSSLAENEYMILLMISIIPMLIIYAIFSKHIIGGFNMSGIKG